jgi:hypothetical protein
VNLRIFCSLVGLAALTVSAHAESLALVPPPSAAQLPEQLSRSLNRRVDLLQTRHFELLHTEDDHEARATGALLETLLARFLHASDEAGFALRPPRNRLTWICLDDLDAFERYGVVFEGGTRAGIRSYYSSRTDRVVVYDGDECDHCQGLASKSVRLAHEVAHQLSYNMGLQTRGVMYPLWVSEGLATCFEGAAQSGTARFDDDNPERRLRLQAATSSGRLLSLEELVVATRPPDDPEARNDFYAQCWGLLSFLYREDPERLQRYLAVMGAMHGGRRPAAALAGEFTQAFGTPSSVEQRWRTFIASLPDEGMEAGPADAGPALASSYGSPAPDVMDARGADEVH